MAHLLHIDASPRGERSRSRLMTGEFVREWLAAHPGDTVSYRDIGRNPIPHVTEEWIAAAFTPPDLRTPAMRAALRLSDELIDELEAADVIVAGVPLYNFGMPSVFKAYVDQIVRVGRTVVFEPDDPAAPYKPVLAGKRMFVVAATGDGGYEAGGPNRALNHLEPHLRTAFGFIGISDVTFVYVENDEFGGARLAESLAAARSRIRRIVADASVAA